MFKEEIAKNFMNNYKLVKEFLSNKGFLDFLTDEELEIIGTLDFMNNKNTKNQLQLYLNSFLYKFK